MATARRLKRQEIANLLHGEPYEAAVAVYGEVGTDVYLIRYFKIRYRNKSSMETRVKVEVEVEDEVKADNDVKSLPEQSYETG
jgi:hypothetical protein